MRGRRRVAELPRRRAAVRALAGPAGLRRQHRPSRGAPAAPTNHPVAGRHRRHLHRLGARLQRTHHRHRSRGPAQDRRGQPAPPQVQPLQQVRPQQKKGARLQLHRVLQEVAVTGERGGREDRHAQDPATGHPLLVAGLLPRRHTQQQLFAASRAPAPRPRVRRLTNSPIPYIILLLKLNVY